MASPVEVEAPVTMQRGDVRKSCPRCHSQAPNPV
jgi:hypothetical protein